MEKWDLYDAKRNKLNRTVNRGEPLPPGTYHLVVHLCLFNSDGQLLCQRRTITKATYPLYWDVTVGGSALSGEDSKQAIHREVVEEIGLDIDFSQVEKIFTVTFIEYIDDYYFIISDINPEDLVLQKDEVCAVAYYDLDEIEKMIKEGNFVDYAHFDRIKAYHRKVFEK